MTKRSTLLFVLMQMLLGGIAGAQNINTIAGGLGDNGAATAGKLYNPNNVAVDKWGNIYVADYGNNLLRKISPAGIITSINGVGSIKGVATDTSGNVYVADINGRVVRKINISGTVTVYAGTGSYGWSGDGGQATAARTSANAVAVDRSGNLYISDYDNFRIRKVNTSGIISTIAGNGTGGFSGDGGQATAASIIGVTGIGVDNNGNVYIAENTSNRVRKITPAGIITTFAGNGIVGYAGDGGPATSANFNKIYGVAADTSGNVYIADNLNNQIRKVNSAGIITRVAGSFISGGFSGDGGAATSAQLSNPTGIAIDNAGNFYIADNSNHRIRKVNSSGNISTVAGCDFHSAQGYGGDGGPVHSALLHTPYGVTIDTAGNMLIADRNNNVIRKVSPAGTIITFAGKNTSGYSGDGGPATNAELWFPSSVVTDKKGNTYICDANNARIRKIDGSGIISTYAGNGSGTYSGDGLHADSAGFGAFVIAIDKIGNLYIADRTNNRIRKVDTNRIITTICGTGTAGYFGDGGAATSAQLNQPYGVCLDDTGNIYIADRNNSRVRKIDLAGTITTVAGGGTGGIGGLAIYAALGQTTGVLTDRPGNLYLLAGNQVLKVNNAGVISIFAGIGSNGFYGDGGPAINAKFSLTGLPIEMAVDTSGNIFIPDNNRIRIVYNASISISTPNTATCTGTSTTFTATITAAPIYTPYYHWKLNGLDVGTNSPVYTTTTLINGDRISCTITDGTTGPAIATSNEVTMTVIAPSALPACTIVASPGSTVCAGTTVTCNPTVISYGGATPVFEWFKNGVHVFTGTAYIFVPIHSDIVFCKIRSSITCLTSDTGYSNTINFTVNAPAVPAVSVHVTGTGSPTPTYASCVGITLSCNVWASSSAVSAVYKWYKNGVLAYTGNLYTFTPVAGDTVHCVMTTSATCVLTDTAISNTIHFIVNTPAYPTINITANTSDTICPGAAVICTATATLTGTTPNYDWFKNGIYAHSGDTYPFNPANGDSVYCRLVSNHNCVIATTAYSNPIKFIHSVPVAASVNFSIDPATAICNGTTVTLNATPVNGGTSPLLEWYKNGSKAYTGNPYSFVPGNGNEVYCRLTSNDCATPIPALSPSVTFTVTSAPVPNVNISVSPGKIVCAGIPVSCTPAATNAGSAPVFNWYVNNANVYSGNQFNFTPSSGDEVYCIVTSNAECANSATDKSNVITFGSDSLPSITITSSPSQVVFSGTAITLSANVSASSSTYQLQWVKNGNPIPGATDYIYTSSDFSIWDSVKCILTASGTCSGSVSSNALVINTYHGMKLYPNPNYGDFVITGNNHDANSDPVNIRIYTSAGKLVYEKQASFDAITFYTEIKLGRILPPGTYMLRMSYSLDNLSFFFVIR